MVRRCVAVTMVKGMSSSSACVPPRRCGGRGMLATMLGSLREVVSSSACETLHPTLGVALMTSCGSSVAPRSPVPHLRLALLAVVRLNLILAVGVCVDRRRLLGGDVWRGLGVALEIADGCRVGDVGIVGVSSRPCERARAR